MRRRVVLPIAKDLAGLGERHLVNHAVALAATCGEGAIKSADPRLKPGEGAGIASVIVAELAESPGVTRGSASPGGGSFGESPAQLRIAATAAFNSARLASRSSTVSTVSSGYAAAS